MASAGLVNYLLALHILCCNYWVDGYPNGAPRSTCWTRYPKHKGLGTQKTPCTIGVTFSPSAYAPGREITVKVEDPSLDKIWFSGIQMAAFRAFDNKEEIVGRFINYPDSKLQAFTCFGGFKNMITHKNKLKVQTLQLTWKAPNENVGNITFKTTIVANFETFWTDLKSHLPSANQNAAAIKPPLYKGIITKHLVKNINFRGCGDTKGCFLYPQQCEGKDCLAAVNFWHRKLTDDYLFEVYTTAAANWISLGFSDDPMMGKDETITCVSYSGYTKIQHGWNPAYYNERMLTRFLSEVEIRQSDGQLQCKFVLPRKSSAYIINQASNVFNYTNITFDREQDWYLMLAWGTVMPGSDVLAKHVEMPAVTCKKINLKQMAIHQGTSFPALVKIHAAFMIIAWVFFAGIITVKARHYRNWYSGVTLFGTRVWFQVHRNVACLIFLLTAIGIVVIFVQYGKQIRQHSVPHSYVGLAVVAVLCAQIFAGFLRPGLDHKMRFWYNWTHRFLGQSAHILAVVSMFLAFDIVYINKNQKIFGFTVLSVWVGVQLLWHIVFEVLSYQGMPLSSSWQNSDKDENNDNLQSVLLFAYILTLAVLCTAALLAFLLF